jgi:hypothetical protein
MIWLFDRGDEQIRYEICREDEGAGFLLVITSSAGQKRVERVDEPTELIERSIEQMRRLTEDGWKIG